MASVDTFPKRELSEDDKKRLTPIPVTTKAGRARNIKDVVQEEKPKTTTTMIFPKAVTIALPDQTFITFTEGTQEVPNEYVNHWYVIANGAKVYNKETT